MIDTCVPLMRLNGRIIFSGQTADYGVPVEDRDGVKNTSEIIGSRPRMQGLVLFDDILQFPVAQEERSAFIRDGKLIFREEIIEGLESLPSAFCGVFKNENFDRRLVKMRG